MQLTNNYSITQLFLNKKIKIFNEQEYLLSINLKTVRDILENEQWNKAYYFFSMSESQWAQFGMAEKDSWECLTILCFELGYYKEFSTLAQIIKQGLKELNSKTDIDYKHKEIRMEGVTITSEIWNYIVYLLKLSYGEKVTKPLTFHTPEEKEFYRQQQAAEERIRKIKQENNKDDEGENDGLIKMMLTIIYSFPSLTFDYLFDQTMAQIQWLHKMAVGEISYSFNEKVAAAGNMKKGKKLDFFIK